MFTYKFHNSILDYIINTKNAKQFFKFFSFMTFIYSVAGSLKVDKDVASKKDRQNCSPWSRKYQTTVSNLKLMHALHHAMCGPLSSVQDDKALRRVTVCPQAKVLHSLHTLHELGMHEVSMLQLWPEIVPEIVKIIWLFSWFIFHN